jgi:hypothetical protein
MNLDSRTVTIVGVLPVGLSLSREMRRDRAGAKLLKFSR